MEAVDYRTLKERQRVERGSYHPNLVLGVHQALSWLSWAEQADDLDGRFIILWIAFSTACATEIEDSSRLSEQSAFVGFLNALCEQGQPEYTLSVLRKIAALDISNVALGALFRSDLLISSMATGSIRWVLADYVTNGSNDIFYNFIIITSQVKVWNHSVILSLSMSGARLLNWKSYSRSQVITSFILASI